MKIVLFSGKAEAGKTASAKILKDLLTATGKRAAIVPYASYLKEVARTVADWDGRKDEAGRELLQQLGTNVIRKVDPDFWVGTVLRLAGVLDKAKLLEVLIVDDCRFPNEINWWNGWDALSVRIERPGHSNALTEEQRQHISETALDNYSFDLTISADSLPSLRAQIATEILVPLLVQLEDGQWRQ